MASSPTSNVFNQFPCKVWAFIKSGAYPVPSPGAPLPGYLINDEPINMLLSCNFQMMGRYGLTLRGMVNSVGALIPAQSTFGNVHEFSNGIVDVTLIKDIATGNMYYCDTVDYEANINQCNVAVLQPLGTPNLSITNSTGSGILHQSSLTDGADGYLVIAVSGTSIAALPPFPALISINPYVSCIYSHLGYDGTTLAFFSPGSYTIFSAALSNSGVMSGTWARTTITF